MSKLLTQVSGKLKIKSKSIISTIFGDLVEPFGGNVWLDSLATICNPLGINERLVRTSLFRLASDDWVISVKHGRRSYYQLSETGKKQTAIAEKKIYSYQPPHWSGEWTLVFLVVEQFPRIQRRELERKLRWMGFGSISRNVWGHPNVSKEQVNDMVDELKLQDVITCMRASKVTNSGWNLNLSDQQLAAFCIPLEEVENHYQHFVKVFSKIRKHHLDQLSEAESMALRIVLIDEYRKVVLKDPILPAELLPNQWVGYDAYDCCKQLYLKLVNDTDHYYIAHFMKGEVLNNKRQRFAKQRFLT